MGPFHEGEESGGVVQVDTWTDSLSGDRGEFHRFARLPDDPAREDLPKGILYDRCQRFASVVGEAFGRFQELIVESNSCAHVAKHIDQASICQAAVSLAKNDDSGLVCPVYLVYLVCLVCLVFLVYLVGRNQRVEQNKPDQPDEPNQPGQPSA